VRHRGVQAGSHLQHAFDEARAGGGERVGLWYRHRRIPSPLRGAGQGKVTVFAPEQEAAPAVVGPEEMDCEH
jgi:hypothetical protein